MATGLPRWPLAWYVVARSRDLARGGVLAGSIAGRAYVLWRSERGELAACDAFCPHMGAHLGHGEVRGEELRCPLHHWRIDVAGACRGPGATADHRARTWPVVERFGLVFIHPGGDPPPPPAPADPGAYAWITGRPVSLATSWQAMMVNGFDLLHLGAVHHRRLVEPPSFTLREAGLELVYTSRVVGGGLADRAMRWLSGDRIRVRQTCYGPVVVVETDLGHTKTAAVLGLTSEGDRVRAFGAFGALRGHPLHALHLLLARWLFLAFLRKDFAVVEGMCLKLEGVEDEGVRAIAAFLASLPEVGHG